VKAELLVNVKTASGAILVAGSVFSDEHGPLPRFILENLNNPKRVKVISTVPIAREAPVPTTTISADTKEKKVIIKKRISNVKK
jgi:hypothetical protein